MKKSVTGGRQGLLLIVICRGRGLPAIVIGGELSIEQYFRRFVPKKGAVLSYIDLFFERKEAHFL